MDRATTPVARRDPEYPGKSRISWHAPPGLGTRRLRRRSQPRLPAAASSCTAGCSEEPPLVGSGRDRDRRPYQSTRHCRASWHGWSRTDRQCSSAAHQACTDPPGPRLHSRTT
eukprot:6898372-Pyramimonas_sp.AAC.1